MNSFKANLQKIRESGLSQTQLAVILMIPALVTIALVTFYPLFQTFQLSTQKFNLKFAEARKYVGLANYIKLLHDPLFQEAIKHTLFFTLVSVAAEFILGLVIALVMNKPFPGRGLVRTAVLVPWAIPTVVSSRIWQWMYNDQFGVINDILLKLQIINQSNAWLGNPNTAMWSIIITDTWKTIPFMALLLLAGLQTIPPELYEAAAIDGASSWQRFWHLTLPLLKPAILVSLIFRTLDAFRVYDVVFVMTHGASGTETLAVLNQRVLFSFLDFGYGSAISVIIFLIIFIFSIIYIKMLGLKLETS